METFKPISEKRTWKVNMPPDKVLRTVTDFLSQENAKLTVTSSNSIEATMGFCSKTRLLGGAFVSRSTLPVKVSLSINEKTSETTEMNVTVQDNMGFGSRIGIESKYRDYIEDLLDKLEDNLKPQKPSQELHSSKNSAQTLNCLWVMESVGLKRTSYNLFFDKDKLLVTKLHTHSGPTLSTFRKTSTGKMVVSAILFGGIIGGTSDALGARNRHKIMEKATENAKLPIDQILESKESCTINKSDIQRVRLERAGILKDFVYLTIKTENKRYKWDVMGIPGKEKGEFEEIKRILRSEFSEKLDVKD
jgi:hypothetical protein